MPEVNYYNREDMLSNKNEIEPGTKLFGYNEAILAGQAQDLPLFSVRERAMANAYAAVHSADEDDNVE